MTTKRRTDGGTSRRVPAHRAWARPPGLALIGLALIGLAQGGCKSDGCSTCGGFGSKITQGFNNGVAAVGRAFNNHKCKSCGSSGGGGCASCGGEEGTIIEGMPVAAPGAMVIPGPGTIVPGPSIESAPSQLEAIPPASTGATGPANPASNRGGSGNTRSSYEASAPRNSLTRRPGGELARALLSTGDGKSRGEEPVDSANLFEKIPPVDIPADVTRKAATTSPTPAVAAPPAASNPEPAAPTAAENHSAAEGGAAAISAAAASAPQAPGIRRTASVGPTIAGGSVPSIEGLDWLKEKGYRTFVDLRKGAEVDPTFADSVNDRGMVYISLPIVASRLDPNRLARFDDLIARSENRPLYFCDSDGTRAGLLWYLHLRSVAGEDSQSAGPKAEEVGLNEEYRQLADVYLLTHKPRPKVAAAPAPAPATEPAPIASPAPAPVMTPPAQQVATAAEVARNPEPAVPADTPPLSVELPEPPVQLPPSSSDSPPLPMIPGEATTRSPGSTASLLRDPATWRPIAALALTGIGIPLAYWSRSAISVARSTVRRASLPAAARRSLEAPAGSDV